MPTSSSGAESSLEPYREEPVGLDSVALRVALGNNIRIVRERSGMTQTDLARLCHVTRETIYKLEGGKQEARFRTVAMLAVAMRVPIADFIEGLDDVIRRRADTD